MPLGNTNAKIRGHKNFNPQGAGGGAYMRIPKTIGYAEDNFVFGMGSQVLGGAGALTLTSAVPRPVILRDLIIACGAVRGRISAIGAAGVALVQGSTLAIETFSPLCVGRPSLDLPVYTGNATLAGTMDAAATVDAGWAID